MARWHTLYFFPANTIKKGRYLAMNVSDNIEETAQKVYDHEMFYGQTRLYTNS